MQETIQVRVRSETDRLETVLMCWANPFRITVRLLASVINTSVRQQLRHNAWMNFDYLRVREQQLQFVQVLRRHGVTVMILGNLPGINSQHFTRDIGFCIDNAFFPARMGTPYREPERRALGKFLPRLSKVVHLERGRIEGGDVMLFADKVLVGLGEATNTEAVEELRRKLAELDNPREVVPVPFAQRGVVHLDTRFNLVGENVALFARKSFGPDTIRWFENYFDLIEATDEETANFEINTLAVGNDHVVMQNRSERLAREVQRRGLTPILVEYSEVTRWPGSFRCTTLPLKRAG